MMTDAFESFAHALRISLEAHLRVYELLMVDPHEAAGNVEQGTTQLLNAVASIYDISQSFPEFIFDWYGTPETALILAIRNARHHNHANRIRGLYNYHLQQPSPSNPRKYVFVDYPETEDGGKAFDVPISWYDLSVLLDMPLKESRLRSSTVSSLRLYLRAELMNSYAAQCGVSPENVFFNINPLIVNAARKFVPLLRPLVSPRSLEGRWFASHFENVYPADISTHVVSEFSVFLPA